MHVNGKLTLGENIGDLSGLAVAYQRLQDVARTARTRPVIDGFTGDQRFFLGWAQVWRAQVPRRRAAQAPADGSAQPGEYRTNGVVRNMAAFDEAFDVKAGDKLYLPPDERVRIW